MNRRSSAGLGALPILGLAAALAAGCTPGTPYVDDVASSSAAPLTQDQVATGGTCSSSGAHGKHATFACSVCHVCGGFLQFDPAGPAYSAGNPAPGFDAAAKTCSSVGCHGIYSGTFSYWFPNGEGEPELKTVSYTGNGGGTPSWYATSGSCAACHGNPPPQYLAWHGMHGGGNDCQLCHPSAVGTGGVGTALSTATNCGPSRNLPCASLHANGTVDVTPAFRSACFSCH